MNREEAQPQVPYSANTIDSIEEQYYEQDAEEADRGQDDPLNQFGALTSVNQEPEAYSAPEVWSFEPAVVSGSERDSGAPAASADADSASAVIEESSSLGDSEVELETDSSPREPEAQEVLLEADVPQPDPSQEKPELKVAFGTKNRSKLRHKAPMELLHSYKRTGRQKKSCSWKRSFRLNSVMKNRQRRFNGRVCFSEAVQSRRHSRRLDSVSCSVKKR